MNSDPRSLLRSLLDVAIASAQAGRCLPPYLPTPVRGRTVVVGAGKAAAAMALAFENHWQGPLEGGVVTRAGYEQACRRLSVEVAAHPVPDDASLRAADRMLARVRGLGADDQVVCLLSGGGSSLLCAPLPGVSAADKRELTRALLRSGASISEINCVRRHLSRIKGGRLAAAAHPAPCHTLLISDVPGDDPVDIASGPTVGDPSTCADALAVLARHGMDIPPTVRQVLESGAGESVKPGDPRLAGARVQVIATPRMALEAAAATARDAGLQAHILGDDLEGEASELGTVLAGISRSIARHGEPFARPCVLLSGGETTVRVRGQGRGGRNVEFLLALALALRGEPGVHAIAADTDGVDGIEEIAGAIIGPDTLARAHALGLDARAALEDNDAHGFFGALGDSVVTGPTYTNVNDFRAILIEARK